MARLHAVRCAEANLPTPHGTFRFIVYRDVATGKEHAALVAGVPPADGALVRIHSECLTGDIFASLRCDCGSQLDVALEAVAKDGGAVLYLRQEGRDIGLTQKIRAYELQEKGLDTVEANLRLGHPDDARSYEAAHDMLADLGIRSVRLLTNNPRKIEAMESAGIDVVERVPLVVPATDTNRFYLETKRDKMGHLLD